MSATDKKLFYTDALKAAWMTKEFGVEFYDGSKPSVEGECKSFHASNNLLYPLVDTHKKVTYYVHPDNYGIFEPKENDLVQYEDGAVQYVRTGWVISNDEHGVNVTWGANLQGTDYHEFLVKPEDVEIIQRDGKAFFQPESEQNSGQPE